MARPLKQGDQGPEVKEIQSLLMDKAYLTEEHGVIHEFIPG